MAKKPTTQNRSSERERYLARWRDKNPEQLAVAYQNIRRNLARQFEGDAEKQRKALARFDADPRVQAMRQISGLAPVSTRNAEVKKIAQRNRSAAIERAGREVGSRKGVSGDFGTAIKAGITRGAFGIPERLAAAGLYYTGNSGNLDYDETLQAVRARTNAELEGSGVGNFLGQLLGGGAAGAAATRAVAAGGAGLAATAAPVAQRVGRAIQGALQLRRGETARNTAKIVAGGTAAGTAQAAGEGSDVATGAALGATGSLALGAGAKAAGFLGSKAADVLRLTGADAILRRYTSTTREALQGRLDEFRRRTGAEPTIYELLDLNDRQELQKVFSRLDRGQQERGAGMARARVESIPREVAQVVRNETRGQRRRNISTLASAQAGSRGAPAPTMEEARLAVGAADNPTNLAQIRRNEARNIMGPYDNRQAVESINELIPTEPRALNPDRPGEITEVEIDPEISRMIRAAAGTARLRPEGEGITIRELTDMLSGLREEAGNANRSMIERSAAGRAADHLENVIAERHPDVAPALARMNEAWAARSRQLEGMREIRPQTDVDPSTAQRLQRSENVYDSPEGATGRQAAQRRELLEDLGAANAPALATVRQLAESDTTARTIAGNIGVPATRNITDAARAQSESVRRLATAVRDPKFDVTEIESGDLALLAAGLNPASMAYTKARALTVMLQRFGNSIPESRSRTIVDMLFSRDPAMTQRAINALRSQGEGGSEALRNIINATANALTSEARNGGTGDESAVLGPDAASVDEPAGEPDYSQMSDEELMQVLEAEEAEEAEEPDYSQMSDEELMQVLEAEKNMAPFGRRVIEDLFPEAEITDDLRDPTSDLGRKNPGSYHVHTDGAVDLRPIPGMTFNEFVNTLKAEGYNVVEAIDETKKRSKHATGPHWHVVIG